MSIRNLLHRTGTLLLLAPLLAQADCRVEARPVAFGMLWDLQRSGANAEGLVLVDCAGAINLRVSMGPGLNAVQASGRRLLNGAMPLPYNLYTDAAHSQLWGDGSAGTVAPFTPAQAMLTVYARIPATQPPAAGAYTDAVEVTVDW